MTLQGVTQPVIRLQPVGSTGHDRVAAWLATPEVGAWWGGADSAQAHIHLARATEHAICRLVLLGDEPIGYGQAMDAADAGRDFAPATWTCDLFIGAASKRGFGYWSAAMDQLVGEVFATTLALGCAVVVPIRHERVARAAERIGFGWQSITALPRAGPAWVMVRPRPPSGQFRSGG